MIKIEAYAKINLFLEVTAKRWDGYHDLATLFARIGLRDTLSLYRKRVPGVRLSVKGGPKELGKTEDNIVYKAAKKFFEVFDVAGGVEIRLLKRIPVGAGLGGGSSDAAATLAGLAKLYGLPRKARGRLMSIAASIGSDVPFFMLNAPAAEGYGRGEKLKVVKTLRMPRIVLVYPGEPVYTKEVYGNLKLGERNEIKANLGHFGRLSALIKAGKFLPGRSGIIFNRLEVPVLPVHKSVRSAKERLISLGADAAMMSGSGASVFGLCGSPARARRIAAAMKRIPGYSVFLTKFC